MLLRRVLTRLLLLSVFFNTVVGMPAHEADHLRQTAAAAVTAQLAQQADQDAFASEQGDEAQSACAWCLAYAHLGTALTSLPAVHALAAPQELPKRLAQVVFVPRLHRQPFSSRDPPHAVA
jgi:hypothetical protein